MEKLPTGSETPKDGSLGTSKEQLATTLNIAVTGNGEYFEGRSRQNYIDELFEKALAAKERGDTDAFRDYMKQIDNLNDEAVLGE